MQFRNMKIGIRAAGLFTLLGILVLAMGLVALYETRKMDSATDEIRITWMPAVLALGEVSSNLGRARALTLRSALEQNAAARHATLARIVEVNRQLEDDLEAYEKTIINAEDRALFSTFMGLSERYHGLQKAIRDAAADEQLDEARRLINGPLAEYADSMMQALAALIDYNTKGAEQASQRSSDASDEAFSLIVATLALILLALVAIATLLTRSIVLPLADAVAIAERVATGDLTREIVITGRDEPALLLSALSRMQHSLRHPAADRRRVRPTGLGLRRAAHRHRGHQPRPATAERRDRPGRHRRQPDDRCGRGGGQQRREYRRCLPGRRPDHPRRARPGQPGAELDPAPGERCHGNLP